MLSFQIGLWYRPTLVVGSVAGLILWAGSTSIPAQAPNPGGAANEANMMFRNLDTNQDGKLTLEEAGPNSRNLMQAVFEMAGKQRGASISREEFQTVFDRRKGQSGGGGRPGPPPPGGRPGPPPGGRPGPPGGGRPDAETEMPEESDPSNDSELPPLLAQLDGNGDGKLTRGELQRLTQMFDRLDGDKDGALSVDEIRGAERLPRTETKAKAEPKARTDTKSKSESSSPSRGSRGASTKSADSGDGGSETRTTNRPAGNTASARGGNRSQPTGVWRGWVVDGRGENPNAGQMEVELTIEGNQITGRELGTQRAPGGLGGGRFVMTGDGRSGNLDAEGNAGPQDGRSFQGIYEFDGETLRWCVSNRGRQRPTTMATERGNYLLILRRQQ